MLHLPIIEIPLRTREHGSTMQVWDDIRRRWVALTPEEHVRQSLLQHLILQAAYPKSLIAVERGVSVGHTMLRFDAVVFRRGTAQPWMLVECKSPQVPITDAVLHQLLHYHSKLPECRYWLLSNGRQSFCADCTHPEGIRWLDSLPAYEP